MQQPIQRALEVSTLSVAARTVVLEGASVEGPPEIGLFDIAMDALAHWKGAALAGATALALAWVVTEGMRSTAKAEFLLEAPIDEFSQLKSAADAARAIELAPVRSADGGSMVTITAKPDKTSNLISTSFGVSRAMPPADVRAEAGRITKELNAGLAEAFAQATRMVDDRLKSIDDSIAEARMILDHPERLPAQSDAIGLVMAEVVKLRDERGSLLRRREAASSLRMVGEVRVTEPKFLDVGNLVPPLAAAGTFVTSAVILRGVAQARSRRAAARGGN